MRPQGEVLARALPHAHGHVVDGVDAQGEWSPLVALLEPDRLRRAIADRAARTSTSDDVAVGSVLCRDLIAPLVRVAVAAWSEDRVVLDVSCANVAVDLGGERPRLALRRPGGSGPTDDDTALLDRVERVVLDAAVGPVVDALRVVVRVGGRHLWGSAALAVVNTLATLSHRPGSRADADRAALLARRPDLERLVDVVSVPDGRGGTITYAIRRTCCLLAKLPRAEMCGTCSLRPRPERIASCDEHYRAERAATVGG